MNNKPTTERGTWNLYTCADCVGHYVSAWFAIAGYPATKMLHDPTDLWNGWHNPQFTREQAETFVAWMNAPAQSDLWAESMLEKFKFEDNKLLTMWIYNDGSTSGWNEISPTLIDGKPYYGIGSWSWCWVACDSELEANEG
jgi:hypothetical protein